MPRLLFRILKWAGIALGGLLVVIVVAVVAVVAVYFIAGARINKTYDIQVEAITVPTDAESIARGKHVVQSFGLCQECHGDMLEGDVMEDDPVFGRLVAMNLTPGKGGIGGSRSDVDFVRAIRHGVSPDGKSLIIMPSDVFYYMSDADLGDIIAYLKSLPPVDNEVPTSKAGPLARLLILLGAPFLVAGEIDHTGPRSVAPEPGVTVEYGRYLGRSGTFCHGDDLSGEGGSAGGEIDPPNLTPGGRLGRWSEDDFVKTLRTGITPRGYELDSEEMPWESIGRLTDDELTALWMFVRSVPSVVPE